MAVSPFRITAKQLLPRIRQCAKSQNVMFTPPLVRQSMAGMMTFHQSLKCLQEGSLIGKPKVDEHGNWLFRMERFAAGEAQIVHAVAIVNGVHVEKILVLLED
jgi:hypothetical protein